MSHLTIAVVTTSRADWGHVEPVLRQMIRCDGIGTQLIVGGAHLEEQFGRTIDCIQAAGYEVAAQVPFLSDDDSDLAMGEAIGHATVGFSQVLAQLRPDILLLIADRFEMLAPASAAMALRIPIAHIEGGEISEGAIDQQVRDALTKMSHLHLVPTGDARQRVISMGEDPWRVTVTGARHRLIIWCLMSCPIVRKSKLPSRCPSSGIHPSPVVVAFHPTTMHRNTTDEAEVFFELPDDNSNLRKMVMMAILSLTSSQLFLTRVCVS